MIQDQLVEYISSQTKLGVSRDAIKSALVGAGWQAGDVEDSLKKVEGGAVQPATATLQPQSMAQKPSIQAAQPMVSGTPISKPSSPLASFSPSDIIGGAKTMPSQPIRMGDLVAAPAQNSTKNFFGKKTEKSMSGTSEYPPKTKGFPIATIIEAVVIVGLAALSGFLYFQNSALSTKVSGLGGQSTDVTSQISNLTAQVQNFTASNAGLTAQVASLTAQNTDLQTSLSFSMVPSPVNSSGSSVSPAATTTTATITGILSGGGKAPYIITTAYGVKVSIKNSSDAKVIAAFMPMIGITIQVSGTHLQGSALLTVTDINGSPLAQIIQSASSTPPLIPPLPGHTPSTTLP